MYVWWVWNKPFRAVWWMSWFSVSRLLVSGMLTWVCCQHTRQKLRTNSCKLTSTCVSDTCSLPQINRRHTKWRILIASEVCCSGLISAAVTNTLTESSEGKKGFLPRGIIILQHCPLIRDGKARTQYMNLKSLPAISHITISNKRSHFTAKEGQKEQGGGKGEGWGRWWVEWGLLAHRQAYSQLDFKTTCLEIVLPTVGCAFPYQLTIKTIPHWSAHGPVWSRQVLNSGSPGQPLTYWSPGNITHCRLPLLLFFWR